MRETLDLSCVPSDEPCAQIGQDDYHQRATKECRAYIAQLIRQLGKPPDGAALRIKSNPHDFGSYLSVVAAFDPTDPKQVEWAYKCDANAPGNWDDEAKKQLGLVS
jgi:hypothetical protein